MSDSSSLYNHNIPYLKQNVNSINSDTIKTYPELNAVALTQHLDRELMVLYILRLVDQKHCGFISYSDAVEGLKTLGGYKRNKVYSLLNSGNGTFYEKFYTKKGIKYLKLYSIEKIALYFGLKHLSRATLINLKNCDGLLKTRKELYSSFFPSEEEDKVVHPMARETIKIKTGLSRQRQQRYEKDGKVQSKQNYVKEKTAYEGKCKEYFCNQQLGNSYISQNPKANKGNLGKINRNLKKVNNLSYSEVAQGDLHIRYFDRPELSKGIFGERYLIDKKFKDFNFWIRF